MVRTVGQEPTTRTNFAGGRTTTLDGVWFIDMTKAEQIKRKLPANIAKQ